MDRLKGVLDPVPHHFSVTNVSDDHLAVGMEGLLDDDGQVVGSDSRVTETGSPGVGHHATTFQQAWSHLSLRLSLPTIKGDPRVLSHLAEHYPLLVYRDGCGTLTLKTLNSSPGSARRLFQEFRSKYCGGLDIATNHEGERTGFPTAKLDPRLPTIFARALP